jgi:hypothetical protein
MEILSTVRQSNTSFTKKSIKWKKWICYKVRPTWWCFSLLILHTIEPSVLYLYTKQLTRESRLVLKGSDGSLNFRSLSIVQNSERTWRFGVLYGCETLSLTLRGEHRLRVFESRVLRRIFGSKRDEVTGGWRKLHNEELHNFYSSPSIIIMSKSRKMKRTGHVARMREAECL